MKNYCWILTLIFAATILHAEEEGIFRIKPLRETQSTELIQVGHDWLKCPKRIMASLRVSTDTEASKVFAKAYFYDDQKALIHTYDKPCSIWVRTEKGFQATGLPAILEKGRDVDVYFALTDEIEAKKWKSAVVVFGNKEFVAARSRPASAGAGLAFPEKASAKFE